MEGRKISDLVSDAFGEKDYRFRINFLLAGLMSAEANDTAEKEEKNHKLLIDICNYCLSYQGDVEKVKYARETAKTINRFLDMQGEFDE